MDKVATYDIAVVLDDASKRLDVAHATLRNLQAQVAGHLMATDVLFLDPALLVFLLHLQPETFQPEMTSGLALLARAAGFRVLKPMLLSGEQRDRFYERTLSRFSFRALDVKQLEPVFDVLESRLKAGLRGLHAGLDVNPDLRFTVRFRSEEDFIARYRQEASNRAADLFVPCGALPPVGAQIRLVLRLDSGQGPIPVDARVVALRDAETAKMLGTPTGFEITFLPSPNERPLFESFLVALRRGSRWPDAAGRRFERFAIRLPVDYRLGEDLRSEYTTNISRGGIFIESSEPPVVGTELELELYATGRTRSVSLAGKVVHATSAVDAAARGRKSGAGVEFLGPSETVQEKLEQILGSVDVPTVKRAMVVDDDRFFRVVFGNVLKFAGFEVLEASDGQEAFDRLLDVLLRLDLLVLDLYMPGKTGGELVDHVRSIGGDDRLAVVVITSGDLTEGDRQRLLELGADDVISKQIPAEQALRRIEMVLRLKEKGILERER